jgi:predicted nucleic acid-binding Zn ribbon protein
MQAISARPLKTCNKSNCKGKVHRLVSASGFILKGSGWYTSDYPSEARKKGWESEGQNATASSNTNTDNDTSNEKTPAPEPQAAAPAEKNAAKAAPKKLAQKNPYSGGKKSRTKTST